MRLIIFVLIYVYSLFACAQSLVVQSHTITDIYGARFITALDKSEVVFLDTQARPKDVTHTINAFVLAQNYTDVVLLGQLYSIAASKRLPVLTQITLSPVIKGKVYVLSGSSELEQERLGAIEKMVTVTNAYTTGTEFELRKALTDLRSKEKGFLFLNVFHMSDSWNKSYSYAEIEDIVVSTNDKHIDIGICTPGFRTALAVGPTFADIPKVLKGENSTALCASLERLEKLGGMDTYHQLMGTFYRVNPTKD